jgi:hypothetical protein
MAERERSLGAMAERERSLGATLKNKIILILIIKFIESNELLHEI